MNCLKFYLDDCYLYINFYLSMYTLRLQLSQQKLPFSDLYSSLPTV